MNQELTFKSTNYLDPYTFYNKFQFWLVRLEPFINLEHRYPMDANHFIKATEIQYCSGLRIGEVIKLIKADFDLNHRILTIRNPKTAKGKIQKTTILPYQINSLEKFLDQFSDSDLLFPTTRMTMWKYYRNAGRLAGLNIFESQDQRNISNVWTHLLRKSCAKRMEDLGAKESLIARKLRHSTGTVTQRYTKVDINALLDWEEKHMVTLQVLGSVSQ